MFSPSSIEKIKSKKIYALEGNIGAGKTTILKILSKYFKDVEFVEEPVKEWQNLGGMNLLDSFYSNPQRWGFSFEFYSMLTKIQALLKAADSDKPIIIIERSILSNKIFMDLSNELGKLDKMEYCMLTNIYNFYIQNIYPQLSGILYLDTPVDECIKRMKERGRNEEKTLTAEYLTQLDQHFKKVVNASGVPVLYLNGKYDLKTDLPSIEKQLTDFVKENITENTC